MPFSSRINAITILAILFISISEVSTGQIWTAVGTGIPGTGGASCLDTAVGKLYVGGFFDEIDNVNAAQIASWNDTSFSALGSGIGSGQIQACAAVSYNGQTIVGGNFDSAGNSLVNGIARWDGTAWHSIGGGLPASVVFALAVYNGDLIAGGNITTASGQSVNNIVRWNGVSWSAIGNGFNNTVYGLVVQGGNLYACGNFSLEGTLLVNGVAKWNGSSWSSMGPGVGQGTHVMGITAMDTSIYVAGEFVTPGQGIARWDGLHWHALGAIGLRSGDVPYCIAAYKSNIYIGGSIDMVDSVPVGNLARWDGTRWYSMASAINGWVLYMAIYGSSLYIGGSFTVVDGINASGIARCDWITGIPDNSVSKNLSIFPNPTTGSVQVVMRNFTTEQLKINVLDLVGRNLSSYSEENNFTETQSVNIDFSAFPPGVYI